MITLHHVAASRSFRTLWLLEELGLPYEVKTYKITDGSLRDPAFLRISPAGRVPALEMNDQVVFESQAITQTLCEAHPDASLAPVVGSAERVSYLQWLSFAETQASIIASLNLQMVFLRPPAKPSVVVLKLDVARLKATLYPLEQTLASQDWLLKTGFSSADTMLGFNLFAVKYFVHLDGFPNVRAYIDRMEKREAFQRAQAKDGVQEFYDRPFYAPEDFA